MKKLVQIIYFLGFNSFKIIGIFSVASAFGQQNVSISDVPNTPNASSVLDVYSTSKGILVPRLTTLQRLAIAVPANGLLVFDTDVNCFMFYTISSTSWNSLCAAGIPLNGTSVVSNTSVLAPGVTCSNGGITFQMGNDINTNGILDASEVISTNSICNGPNGPIGLTGAQGPIGLTGLTGAVGATGAQGPIGLTGLTGAVGATGAQGPLGAQGPIGLTGLTGSVGATGAQGPIGLTGAAGPTWSLTSNNFTAAGNLQIVTTLPQTVTSTNQAWLVGGNNFATVGQPYRLGTISNDHVDLISNNLVRGRLSNLGELFIGTTNTILAGDLMNGVSNVTFPWAVNGYSSFDGSGVYGAISVGTTVFGGVQGESNGSAAPGVRGTTYTLPLNGVNGSRGGAGANTGWGGLFQNDLGYTGFFGVASDERVKKNIETIHNPLNLIMQLRGVTYYHKLDDPQYSDLGLKPGLNYGFIAQEVETILPALVQEKNIPHINSTQRLSTENKEAELLKTVSYIEMVPLLLEGIKQQQQMIEELKIELEMLKIELNKK